MKKILFPLIALSLSGCATLGDFRITTHKPIPIPDIQPQPMQLKDVKWKVYTVDELKAMIAQMEATGQTSAVFYVLDKDNYDALAFNLVEMKRYIEDQKSTNQYLIKSIKINNGEKPKDDPEP